MTIATRLVRTLLLFGRLVVAVPAMELAHDDTAQRAVLPEFQVMPAAPTAS